MGWSVCWDSEDWCTGVQVGLSIPMPLIRVGSGGGTPSDPIEVQDEESRFAFLVWKGKAAQPDVAGNEGADRRIVAMIFKKQDSWQPVEFTEEERHAFGVGLSEDQVMIDFEFKLARQLFQEPNLQYFKC